MREDNFYRVQMQRSFPIELFDDSPAWEFALRQFIEEARREIRGADVIHVMVVRLPEED